MGAVNPQAGPNYIVATGGVSVIAVPANPTGGIITNPFLATDQGIAAAEVLYVSPVVGANTVANGTTFALQPGQSWTIIPGQTTVTSVNALTAGHKFSVVWW